MRLNINSVCVKGQHLCFFLCSIWLFVSITFQVFLPIPDISSMIQDIEVRLACVQQWRHNTCSWLELQCLKSGVISTQIRQIHQCYGHSILCPDCDMPLTNSIEFLFVCFITSTLWNQPISTQLCVLPFATHDMSDGNLTAVRYIQKWTIQTQNLPSNDHLISHETAMNQNHVVSQ